MVIYYGQLFSEIFKYQFIEDILVFFFTCDIRLFNPLRLTLDFTLFYINFRINVVSLHLYYYLARINMVVIIITSEMLKMLLF